MFKPLFFKYFTLMVCLKYLLACSPYFHQPLGPQKAQLGPETPMKKELLKLPEPKEKIVVAVYKFRDQTGQYKPSETGANWSTAVTQGATNILIRALEESGWFIPIERENISNLLNERKIIRSSREQYEGGSSVMLPPLLFAGLLIEGGIVSYETNVFTGGAGVRYFGTDASAQYREDRVTIYLRAVSTSNGKILKTIYTTKSILSQEVSVGVFRYVKYKRLLEAESGFTYNEPTEMAITEAIEKGIQSLIIEGVFDHLWELRDPTGVNSALFTKYRKEKDENIEVDLMGRKFNQHYRGRLLLSVAASGQWYNGDYSSSHFRSGGELNLGFALYRSIFLEAGFSPRYLNIQDVYNGMEYSGNLNLIFMANPYEKYSPYLKVGMGAFFDQPGSANLDDDDGFVGLSDKRFFPYLSFVLGNELLLSNKIGITGSAFYNQFLFDSFDGSSTGSFDDGFWGFDFGVRVYF